MGIINVTARMIEDGWLPPNNTYSNKKAPSFQKFLISDIGTKQNYLESPSQCSLPREAFVNCVSYLDMQ